MRFGNALIGAAGPLLSTAGEIYFGRRTIILPVFFARASNTHLALREEAAERREKK